MKLLGLINDTYKVDFIKNMTKQKQGTSFTNFNITGFEHNIPQSNNWQELLDDSKYKNHLIEMVKQYALEFGSGILSRPTSFIITSREKEYFLSPAGNRVISSCTHKDTDTRFVLHGSKLDSDVAVVCKDTNPLILMIWAYSNLNITNDW